MKRHSKLRMVTPAISRQTELEQPIVTASPALEPPDDLGLLQISLPHHVEKRPGALRDSTSTLTKMGPGSVVQRILRDFRLLFVGIAHLKSADRARQFVMLNDTPNVQPFPDNAQQILGELLSTNTSGVAGD
ncbi:hypothetical protein R75461_07549 [Paraburkholderia nemoris]|nr:hypothetical protein R75461_07549 [Paraburkholderia nemoris]